VANSDNLPRSQSAVSLPILTIGCHFVSTALAFSKCGRFSVSRFLSASPLSASRRERIACAASASSCVAILAYSVSATPLACSILFLIEVASSSSGGLLPPMTSRETSAGACVWTGGFRCRVRPLLAALDRFIPFVGDR
jgi:hypothetical protein